MLVREPEQKNSNSGHCQLWLGLAWEGARWWVGGGLGGRGGRGQAGPSNMMSVDIYKYICLHIYICVYMHNTTEHPVARPAAWSGKNKQPTTATH